MSRLDHANVRPEGVGLMQTIHTATGELLRIGIDALRGLGFSFFQADRLARTIVWNEVTAGNGISFLRHNASKIAASFEARMACDEAIVESGAMYSLDAGGKSLLESGMRALDLAHAGASQKSRGAVIVVNTFGEQIASDYAYQSLQRGRPIMILIRSGHSGSSEGLSVIATMPDFELTLGRGPADPDQFPWDRLAALSGQSIAARFREGIVGRQSGASGSVAAFLSIEGGLDSEPWTGIAQIISDCVAPPSGWTTANGLVKKWKRAIDEGLEVRIEDWNYLFELVARTRIVTSDRSRSQAG